MSLTVQLLPSFAGESSQLQPLTSFRVNDRVAIDAGSLGFALAPDRLADIEHVLLTHAHLDHTVSLPIAIDSAYPHLKHPLRVHGSASTRAAVRKNLFNDEVWVDFTRFNLPGTSTPCLEFHPFEPGHGFELGNLRITPIPVTHPVPTTGLIVESPSAAVVFTSDTWRTDAIWQAAGRLANLKAVFVECSFPNEFENLAEASGHMTARLVAEETAKIGRRVPVYCVHLKPSMRQRVLGELREYARRGIQAMEVGRVYFF